MSFTVAIVGRPNVGKSTLFNRLVGRRTALVDDTPGVTRDRREGTATLADLTFTVIDTAGLETDGGSSLEGRMRAQTERALEAADVALFLIDARTGLMPLDSHFAGWLRGHKTPVIVVANKAEGRDSESGILEAYNLGLGQPVPISAEHNEGMADLYAALLPYAQAGEARDLPTMPVEEKDPTDDDGEAEPRSINLAIVGRPNVGKSTLVNNLLGEERVLTSPEAGTTRDSIATPWQYKGRPVMLIDTAGLRRMARIDDRLENLSVGDTLRTIRFAHVVVLMIDATSPLEKQDLTIARTVIEEGRCLILAVNKWDLIKEKRSVLKAIDDRLETSMQQARGLAVVTLSALRGRGTDKLLPAVFKAYETWNRRIPTARLNRWLAAMTEQHPPPLVGGRRVKLRYMTQAKARPPTFIVFASRLEGLPESYRRYLVNDLRRTFELDGVPIRLHVRGGGDNPFVKN